MNTILEEIKKLKQQQWDYYSEIDPNSQLLNPFLSKEISHPNFIQQYFKRAGKFETFDDFDVTNSIINYGTHTNSIFFLGCILYNNTKIFDKIFPDVLNKPKYHRFPFLWFLTCLFHDLGYEYEKDGSLNAGVDDIDTLKTRFQINNDLLKQQPKEISEKLFKCISSYFLYRKSKNVVDHGILAGLFLYDRLVKIRTRKALDSTDPLYWGKDLESQYSIAGATIASHNIWVNQSNEKEELQKFGLFDLIEFAPLKMNDFPFLYLLGIVDTLDPIKAYKDICNDSTEVLSSLTIKTEKLAIEFSSTKDSKLPFDILRKRSQNLCDWLDVKVISSTKILRIELIE